MSRKVDIEALKSSLEDLYRACNRRELVHPDPLEFLYAYEDSADREIVGLVASSLAYGRVAQILRSVGAVLERMPSPRAFLERATPASLGKTFSGFRHRFTTGDELAATLYSIKRAVKRDGSLRKCFAGAMKSGDKNIFKALCGFVKMLTSAAGCDYNSLLPRPEAGSACKRLNLFLRWMVRKDAVDPGGWEEVPASKLIIPLDTHMYSIGCALGMTERRQAGMRAAVEITEAFRAVCPEDPVKYDFALTRLGIRNDMDMKSFLARCSTAEVA